ncbi:MAG: ankyrin repeat domain-containing protein [Candidatus Delongbacteria bacterium]|jgi:ankyrin repeat protein|nr:ankyrin repeat domain-containing protein [Candidatus Delongbacteria bacterium]
MKTNLFMIIIFVLNLASFAQKGGVSSDKKIKDSLPAIEVKYYYQPTPRFRYKKGDFLTSDSSKTIFNLDTLSGENINDTNQEGISPLLALFYDSSDYFNSVDIKEIYDIVKKYLELGADINIRSVLGITPLMKACEYGMCDIVKLLIENNSDTNIKNYQSKTALHFAVKSGNIEIVKALLQNKADPKVIDFTGRKPIFYAEDNGIIELLEKMSDLNLEEKYILSVMKSDIKKVEECIKERVNINCSFLDKKNALMYACEKGNIEVVKALINSGIEINTTDIYNESALFYAVRSKNVEVVRLLLKNNVIIDNENESSETALILATKLDNADLVKILVTHKADVSVEDIYGNTAIDWAFKNKYQDIIIMITELSNDFEFNNQLLFRSIDEDLFDLIDIIIQKGHNLNLTNDKGQTPLYRSILLKKYKLALKFIKQNVNINIPSDFKLSPLMLTIKYSSNKPLKLKGYEPFAKQFRNYYSYKRINDKKIDQEISLIDTLIKYGANINPKDLNSNPLITSIMTGNFELTKRLIDLGAEINSPDENKSSPLQYLLTYMRNDSTLLDYVKYFYSKGADLEWKNTNNTSVLLYAISSNNVEVAKYVYENLANPDINFIDTRGVTALFYGVKYNNIEMAKYLLELGADINISKKLSNEQNKYKLLHQGIYSGDDINVYLIENGIDINQTFYNQMTPLMLACQRKRLKTTEKLIKHGLDIYAKDKSGKTAFDYGKYNNEIMKILKQYKK